MSDAKPPPPEPTMEEILASIRRIIAEDERPSDPNAGNAAPKNDILELTEALSDEGSLRQVPPGESVPPVMAPTGFAPHPDTPVPALPDGRIEPDPPRNTESDATMTGEKRASGDAGPLLDPDRILSTASAGATAAAFARLAAVPRERRRENDLLLGAGGRTIEDLVRETLRPLLQAWLDEHLPELVERLVRAEIARVVNEAGLR